jgi:hypothetical protein
MLALAVKQNYPGMLTTAGTLLTSEMIAAARTIGTSWMSTGAEPPESDSRKSATVEKTGTHNLNIFNASRDDRNIRLQQQKGDPQQQ